MNYFPYFSSWYRNSIFRLGRVNATTEIESVKSHTFSEVAEPPSIWNFSFRKRKPRRLFELVITMMIREPTRALIGLQSSREVAEGVCKIFIYPSFSNTIDENFEITTQLDFELPENKVTQIRFILLNQNGQVAWESKLHEIPAHPTLLHLPASSASSPGLMEAGNPDDSE